MLKINRFTLATLFLILSLCVSLVNTQPVFADDSTPPTETPVVVDETPTEEPVVENTPTEEPVVESTPTEEPAETPAPDEAETPDETEEGISEEEPITNLLQEIPENTSVVVLNEQAESVPLVSQEAADIVSNAAPIWCPESAVPPIIPGTQGCTLNFSTVNELLENMDEEDPETWAAGYDQHGVIYLAEATITSAVQITSSNYLNLFNNFSSFNLTLQGGLDISTGVITGQTLFNGPNAFLQIGTNENPWGGSVTVNNITLFNAIGGPNASLEVNSEETVNLNDVTVQGSGTGQDGIRITAADANLTNVRVEYADQNGIAITAANEGGTVNLNNVIATNNSGSGVFLNGNNTQLNVIGGSFVKNSRFGIEALYVNSSTLPLANTWTDADDYFPGSVVTIHGNNNSINGVMLGFIPGETVQVDVTGPNGYTASCDAIVTGDGLWTCQITLWNSELAVGSYGYTATGLTSGISISGGFTDARNIQSVTTTGGFPRNAAPGSTFAITVNVQTTGGGTDNDWLATAYRFGNSGPFTCVNHADFTNTGNHSTSITVTVPNTAGSYSLSIIAYNSNTCGSGASSTSTIANAIVVADTVPPVLSLPSNMTVPATSLSGATVTFTATANDTVSGSRPVTCNPASGSTFPMGLTTVNCSATDAAGNTANGSFTVNVVDGIAPTLSLPSNIIEEATSSAGAQVDFTVSATDAIYGPVSAGCSHNSGDTFPLGDTTVNCSASDGSGNTANGSFMITVRDTTAPALSLPSDINEEATSASGAVVTFSLSALDIVDGDLSGSISCSSSSGDTFPFGSTIVDCSVSDAAGNDANGSFTVTIADTTAPAISVQADINVVTSNFTGAVVDYATPTTNDAVDGAGVASCAPASGSMFSAGSTLVTCSATDTNGNTASMSFNVNVTYSSPGGGGGGGGGTTPGGGGGTTPGGGGTTPTIPGTGGGSSSGGGLSFSNSGTTGFIPVTGTVYTFDITCPPASFKQLYQDFTLYFNNLCGYQGTAELLTTSTLPAPLNGQTLISAFSLNTLKGGKPAEKLPIGAEIIIEFNIPAADLDADLQILFWDGKKWVELEGKLKGTVYEATVDHTGVFALVKK